MVKQDCLYYAISNVRIEYSDFTTGVSTSGTVSYPDNTHSIFQFCKVISSKNGSSLHKNAKTTDL